MGKKVLTIYIKYIILEFTYSLGFPPAITGILSTGIISTDRIKKKE
jgi:hypothetical protein